MVNRSPEVVYNKKRSDEGDDLERYALPAVLAADGYDPLARSHLSRGDFDLIGAKPGQLIVVASRLIRVGSASPSLTHTEATKLWRYVGLLTRPGLEVLALAGGAEHAPTVRRDGTWGPCRCSKIPAEELVDADGLPFTARFWRLTGQPVAGRGRRPLWEPWSSDFARSAFATQPLALGGVA
jgi:hypothetical protein